MATEKRELILDMLARNKMGPATGAAARDLDKVGDAADKSSKKTDKLGTSSSMAGEQIDDMGDASKRTQRHIDSLDDEIRKVDQNLLFLAESFARAGSQAEKLDVSRGIRKAENELRRLNKSRDILDAFLPDPDPGEVSKWTNKLAGSITSSLASAPPLAVAGTVLGAAMAPTVGAALAGGVVGAVGAGGIIGGIALVAKDPEVSGYAKRIGQKFSESVNKEAKQAFMAPVKDSLNVLESLAARSAPKIGKIFDNSAPSVKNLTDALSRSADALLDSAVVASSKSGPAMDALGRIIQGTSENVGEFIEMLASHSDEGASALDDLNSGLQNIIDTTTIVVDALADIKGALDSLDGGIDKARYSLEDNVSWLDLTADGYKKGSEAAKLYRDGVIGAAGSVNDYDHYLAGAAERTNKLATEHTNAANAAKGQKDALSLLSRELKAQSDPVFALMNAQDNLKKAQDKSADATSKHGRDSREARKALRDLAEAAIELQNRAGSLGGTFNGKMTPAMKATLRAAGLTKEQMDGLEREFINAKRAADKYAKTYHAKIVTTYVTNKENFVGPVVPGSPYSKRASGGPVARGVPYVVGENGPEIMVPSSSGRIMSAAASRGLNSPGQPMIASAGVSAVRLELAGQAELVSFVRYLIRSANLLQ